MEGIDLVLVYWFDYDLAVLGEEVLQQTVGAHADRPYHVPVLLSLSR